MVMPTKERVVELAREYLGTPFHHQGRLKGVGVDCAGVMIGVGNESGWSEEVLGGAFHYSNYGRTPVGTEMQQVMDDNLTVVSGNRQVGDIFLMVFEREPQHIAILSQLDPPQIIHAYSSVRKVVEHGLDSLWESRIVKTYRFTGVE